MKPPDLERSTDRRVEARDREMRARSPSVREGRRVRLRVERDG